MFEFEALYSHKCIMNEIVVHTSISFFYFNRRLKMKLMFLVMICDLDARIC